MIERKIIKIPTFYPSSKTCSSCGNIKETLTLSERIYHCEYCGLEVDRDYNASINILRKGLEILKEEKVSQKNISGQGLPEELGKYMWLTKAHTSQEAPTSISGSSSPSENIKEFVKWGIELENKEKERIELFHNKEKEEK